MDYAHAGLWEDAVDVLHQAPPGDLMVGFLAAWVLERAGRPEDAQAERRRVRGQSPAFFFPNQLECVPVLESAVRSDPAESAGVVWPRQLPVRPASERGGHRLLRS